MLRDQLKNNYSVDFSFHKLALGDKIDNTELSVNLIEP